MLFCHVTSQVKTDPYQDLLMAKGGMGFPHLAFLDQEGEVLGIHEGDRTVAAFAETGQAVMAYLDLQAKVAAGDESAKADLLIAGIELGIVDYADAKDQADELEMTEDQRARVEALLFDLEVMQTFEAVRMDPKAQERMPELAKMWLAEAKKGRSPTKEQAFFAFWGVILQVADQAGDAEAFRLASEAYHGRFDAKEDPAYQQLLQRLDARLKQLEDKDGDG